MRAGLFEQVLPWNIEASALPPSSRSNTIISALAGGWGDGNTLQTDFSLALLSVNAQTPRRTVSSIPGAYCYGGIECEAVPQQRGEQRLHLR